ncbi:hypothetical protein VB005_05366 [Metarhizium brunneum]
MTLFGEAEDGGNIRRTGSLYKLPSALLSTLSKMCTTHDTQGTDLSECRRKLRQRYPKFAGKIFQSFISRGSIMLVERQHREWEYGHEPSLLTTVRLHSAMQSSQMPNQARDKLNNEPDRPPPCV